MTGGLRPQSTASALVLVSLLTSAACNDDPVVSSSPRFDVDVFYQPAVDFGDYTTFAFRDVAELPEGILSGLSESAQEDLARVNDLAREELRELGLVEADPDAADVHVFSLRNTRGVARTEWDCVPGTWGGYYYWNYHPCAWLDPDYVYADVSTVIVGLVAREREEVVFTGFLQGITGTRDTRDALLESGISRVFARYPVDGVDAGTSEEIDAGAGGSAREAGAPEGSDAASADADSGAAEAG